MMRISRTVWIAAGLVAFSLLTRDATGTQSAAPPFAAGTAWTYKHTMTREGQTRTGTSKDVYRGQVTYREQSYHLVEQTHTLLPGYLERVYLTWDGSRFRQVATVETTGQGSTVEIILDKSLPLAAQDAATGSAQIILNGSSQGHAPWSYTSVSPGQEPVTVPAGAFRATRWDAVFKIGQIESRLTSHTVGLTDVRSEIAQSVAATLALTSVRELVSGPIR
jgi:hypothetical protein